MKRKIISRFCILLAVCLVLTAVLVSCGKENTAENTETAKNTITLNVDDTVKIANKSSSLWEMMANLFPDLIVYKGGAGGYTFKTVNKDLPQNQYDWSDKSSALRGIDVSAYQGTIDWIKVSASNVHFAFIRVGYRGYSSGNLTLDEKFDYNASTAVKVRIPIGVYFVSTALNEAEAEEEAEWVIEQIKPYDVTWPVVLDIEDSGGSEGRAYGLDADTRTKNILAFCKKIKEAGYTPMLYSNIGWFMTKMNFEELSEYDIWLAQYFNQPHFPYAMQIWQATDSGQIEGIKVNVDIDYAMYDYSTGKHMQN